ncbi:MAG TPA: DUF3237 domain-containing protein [Bryobacteraceae bacterium]|nr:DUF3237 domain-containing protein [Bryobacteraceae bacterium]
MHDTWTLSRRDLAKLGATAAGLPLFAAQAPAANSPEPLRSQFLMDLVLETAPGAAAGSHNITPVTGGTFEGPRLKGKVLGPGGDWTTRRPDGVIILDVRTTLETDDGQRIYTTYRGVIYRPQQQPSAATYWRTTPIFDTAAPKYDWLNRIVAVGVRFDVPGKVAYHIYEIL